MLRAFGEKGGVGVYTRNLVSELLALDQANEYVLYYQEASDAGRFADRPNVLEKILPIQNKALWDQIAIPWACRRDRIDLVVHPKFTAPLLARCPAVMVVHGADWFMPDQAHYYHWLDVRYMRAVMPFYFKKCALVISVSRLTTENFNRVLNLPPDKVKTIYFGPARHFQRVTDPRRLAVVRSHYELPPHFILTLTKGRGGDKRKNLGRLFQAYARYHSRTADPVKLVVGGENAAHFQELYHLPLEGYGRDILFPGWIEQADLPAVYTMADLYLYPSNLEAFPIPLTEAMTCGTPIVTSNVNGLAEIAGDAAVLVDPTDPEAIAGAIERVLGDTDLRASLSARGRERARLFTWDRCAREFLASLEALNEGAGEKRYAAP